MGSSLFEIHIRKQPSKYLSNVSAGKHQGEGPFWLSVQVYFCHISHEMTRREHFPIKFYNFFWKLSKRKLINIFVFIFPTFDLLTDDKERTVNFSLSDRVFLMNCFFQE